MLTGSLAFDRIMDFPGKFSEHILPEKIHDLNVSFNIDKLTEKRGGTAGNIAYSAALLGEKPRIVASVGRDADSYIKTIAAWGLPTDGIAVQADVLTAVANIMTDQSDNQITAFYMGAMAVDTTYSLAAIEVDAANPKQTLVVLSAGNKNDMLRYKTECVERGIPYMFDPGQTIPFLTPEEMRTLLDGADIFVCNDYELQMILKRSGLTMQDLQSQVRMIVTTLGANGSTFLIGGDKIDVAACQISGVVDPTGAGDAFRAGLIKGLSIGASPEQCGKLGATAAAYVVEVYGTQEHTYTLQQFAKRYQDNFHEACPCT